MNMVKCVTFCEGKNEQNVLCCDLIQNEFLALIQNLKKKNNLLYHMHHNKVSNENTIQRRKNTEIWIATQIFNTIAYTLVFLFEHWIITVCEVSFQSTQFWRNKNIHSSAPYSTHKRNAPFFVCFVNNNDKTYVMK